MYISFGISKNSFTKNFLWHQYIQIFRESSIFSKKKIVRISKIFAAYDRLDFHKERKVDKAVQKTGLRQIIIAHATNQQESWQR